MHNKPLISRNGNKYEVRGLTIPEALATLQEKVRFIDIREEEDFSLTTADHPYVENIPLLVLLEQMETLDKGDTFLFVDMDGTMAWKAANMLLYNDFSQVYYIAGGILQWKSAGQPIKGRIPDLMSQCGDEGGCGGCSCGSEC